MVLKKPLTAPVKTLFESFEDFEKVWGFYCKAYQRVTGKSADPYGFFEDQPYEMWERNHTVTIQ